MKNREDALRALTKPTKQPGIEFCRLCQWDESGLLKIAITVENRRRTVLSVLSVESCGESKGRSMRAALTLKNIYRGDCQNCQRLLPSVMAVSSGSIRGKMHGLCGDAQLSELVVEI